MVNEGKVHFKSDLISILVCWHADMEICYLLNEERNGEPAPKNVQLFHSCMCSLP